MTARNRGFPENNFQHWLNNARIDGDLDVSGDITQNGEPLSGGSQSVIGPFEWDFNDYVPDDPGIYGSATGGILVAPKGAFAVGTIVQRVLWQIDTALNHTYPSLVTYLGDLATDYVDGGDVLNTATELHAGVSALAVSEANMIANQALLKDPSGGISPVDVRTDGWGGVLIVSANQYFVLFGSFTDTPTQGAGRAWFEIITPAAP